MNLKKSLFKTGFALIFFGASAAYCGNDVPAAGADSNGAINEKKLADVKPGISTKSEVQSLLGTPWRVVQFNDCGMAMEDQADETWDYRGKDSNGTYRVHIEFDDRGIAHLVAKIPDSVAGGKGTAAKVAPTVMAHNMKM